MEESGRRLGAAEQEIAFAHRAERGVILAEGQEAVKTEAEALKELAAGALRSEGMAVQWDGPCRQP